MLNQHTFFNRYLTPRATGASDIDAHPIPRLALLDDLQQCFKSSGVSHLQLEKIAIIGVQHILETTTTLVQHLIELGVPSKNIYLCGKCYSTSASVKISMKNLGIHLFDETKPSVPGKFLESTKQDIQAMWQQLEFDAPQKGIEKIIILDDGGRCFELMPPKLRLEYQIAGVEQTRAGLYVKEVNHLIFPVVDVASSAVKKLIEPSFIAEATINKVKEIMPHFAINNKVVCGVIGCGAIGAAVANYLSQLGFYVLVYDENDAILRNLDIPNVVRVDSIETLIVNSQCVLGCTGKDVTAGLSLLDFISKDITFISCTSEDKEFLSLLKDINKLSQEQKNITDPLDDIVCYTRNGNKITVTGGGYPINFMGRAPWNVPALHIAITQALLFAGIYQAIFEAKKAFTQKGYINVPIKHMLQPELQSYIVQRWQNTLPSEELHHYFPQAFLDLFNSPDWIAEQSNGQRNEQMHSLVPTQRLTCRL